MTSVEKESNAIEVRDLAVRVSTGLLGRRKTLIEGITFSVGRGKTCGFVGPNGAGKSTTIKALLGLCAPSAGSVTLFGAPPSPSTRKRLGYMPEIAALPPTLTPAELVRLHETLSGTKATEDVLVRVGLARVAGQRVGSFSKGMQQRVLLALALLSRPDLLILDEPMTGLDPVGRELVRGIIEDEARRGAAVLFSSHVLSDVERLCDDVVVINDGRLVHAGSIQAFAQADAGGWIVEADDVDEETLAQVRGMGSVEPRGRRVRIRLGADADPLAVARVLKERGAALVGIVRKSPTLEERLLPLLRRSA